MWFAALSLCLYVSVVSVNGRLIYINLPDGSRYGILTAETVNGAGVKTAMLKDSGIYSQCIFQNADDIYLTDPKNKNPIKDSDTIDQYATSLTAEYPLEVHYLKTEGWTVGDTVGFTPKTTFVELSQKLAGILLSFTSNYKMSFDNGMGQMTALCTPTCGAGILKDAGRKKTVYPCPDTRIPDNVYIQGY